MSSGSTGTSSGLQSVYNSLLFSYGGRQPNKSAYVKYFYLDSNASYSVKVEPNTAYTKTFELKNNNYVDTQPPNPSNIKKFF
jgi:hypothetical protein